MNGLPAYDTHRERWVDEIIRLNLADAYAV